MKTRFLPIALAAFAIATSSAWGQFKMQNAAGEAPGQWIFGTIGVGKGPDGKTPKTTALKGLAIRVGENGEAAVAYDLDLCRMVGAWNGKFTTPMNLMSRGEYPTAMGDVAFTNSDVAGFQVGAASEWRDPRPEPFGPLPEIRFQGMWVKEGRTVVKWQVSGTEVLEMPGYEVHDSVGHFTRTFQIGTHPTPLALSLCAAEVADASASPDGSNSFEVQDATGNYVITADALPAGAQWSVASGRLLLTLPASEAPAALRVSIARLPKVLTEKGHPPQREVRRVEDLRSFTTGGPARWPETVTTGIQLAEGADQSAISDSQSAIGYVVDTIKLPEPNPWNAATFIGGFDFFDDGRAALCTFHGDVFIADGFALGKDGKPAGAEPGKVTWRRVAAGLYHALGLKIVKGEIYVTCRDGIYRLKDLNGDGETDFYEVFNNDVKVTKNFHEFVFDLHTDRDGYFYFAKAGPVKNGGRGFDQIMSHHGTLLRVTPDGKAMEVMATGFRAPNGIGVGPNGEMTSGDNEGTWTPMCRLNWIKPGGFYGVVDLAHRSEPPTDYDRPLCWFPKKVDNSSGSQVWVPDNDKWGPWRGQLLHLSYGQCALYGVLKEETIDPEASSCCQSLMQGGVVQFPGLKFESGIMRARFHPVDGQLYVAGLRGWQTSGIKNGCFQRVRYTGAPVRMPIGLAVKKDGIEIQFTRSLDTQAAADRENWSIQAWDYIWSSAYGSPEISTKTPLVAGPNGEPTPESLQASRKHRDPLVVKSVKVGTDDRTVFLEIPDLKPVMQMAIKYQIKSADGAELKGEIVNTIHSLGQE